MHSPGGQGVWQVGCGLVGPQKPAAQGERELFFWTELGCVPVLQVRGHAGHRLGVHLVVDHLQRRRQLPRLARLATRNSSLSTPSRSRPAAL